MIPTLAIGDQIFVNKLVYGVRIPFTAIRVVDFSDCEAEGGALSCEPTEVAHWGGGENPIADFWGVYVHTIPATGDTYILGSDRGIDAENGLVGGLKIFATP